MIERCAVRRVAGQDRGDRPLGLGRDVAARRDHLQFQKRGQLGGRGRVAQKSDDPLLRRACGPEVAYPRLVLRQQPLPCQVVGPRAGGGPQPFHQGRRRRVRVRRGEARSLLGLGGRLIGAAGAHLLRGCQPRADRQVGIAGRADQRIDPARRRDDGDAKPERRRARQAAGRGRRHRRLARRAVGVQQAPRHFDPDRVGLVVGQQAARAVAVDLGQLVAVDGDVARLGAQTGARPRPPKRQGQRQGDGDGKRDGDEPEHGGRMYASPRAGGTPGGGVRPSAETAVRGQPFE